MSKLSFRARALDASKPMPIYLAEELPDLPDYSAINRAVPQMPSGMEKEEECEHHLQRAICTGLIIPTPEVCSVDDIEFYERCYPPDYKMPKQHIHMQPLWQEQEAPEYDIDSEDERWLKQQRHPELTELKFEQMMDKLERSSGQTVATLSEAKLLLERHDDLVIAVYDYWLNKRLKTQHPLILAVKTDTRPGHSTNNPYLAFRRRTEKMQTRKNRKNDESSYEKMLKLRRDLARALMLLELVAKRERAKRDLVRLTALLSERRYHAGDFAGQLLADLPPSRPTYSVSSLAAQTASFRREAYAPRYPAHAPAPRHAPPPDQPRQREKRPYKRRKHRHHGVVSAQGHRDSGVYTSSEEETATAHDDGPFAFRRKAGCYYEMPTSTLYGDPVDPENTSKDGLFQHELDNRLRFTLTSIREPFPQCVGFARRRVCRGGRVALDRVVTPLDGLWRRLPFHFPRSSRYKAERAEEVEFETERHREPKTLTRDYHTRGAHPWRHAFRRDRALWTRGAPGDPPHRKLDDTVHGSVGDALDGKLQIKQEIDTDTADLPTSDFPKMETDTDAAHIKTDYSDNRSDSYRVTSDISVGRTFDEDAPPPRRKRAWSRSSDSSYDSDEKLEPVEEEFERFIEEVNKKWLHFRPKTPPPAPPSPPAADDDYQTVSLDTPLTAELRGGADLPSASLGEFTTTEFTLAELYGDALLNQEADNSGSSLDVNGDDLLGENLGLTEAQVESILSETDLKALSDVDLSRDDTKILEELVGDADRDTFLWQGQGRSGPNSGPGPRRARASLGCSSVRVTGTAPALLLPAAPPALPPQPVKVPPPKPVASPAAAPLRAPVAPPRPSPAPQPPGGAPAEPPPPHVEPPRLKVEQKKTPAQQPPPARPAPAPEPPASKAPAAAHKQSPLKKRPPPAREPLTLLHTGQDSPRAQILTVAVSESLKMRLQNHLLSSQAASGGPTVVGLVQNGPLQTSGVTTREIGSVGVSVAGTSSPRRVTTPVVHLTPAAIHQKQLQLSQQQPVVMAPSHTIQHMPTNKLKVLHAHPLTQTQRTQLLAQSRAAGITNLPTVVSLATLGEAKTTPTQLQLKGTPGSVTQFFEIKGGQLGKGPTLVNVVRQPQPGKTTVARLDLNDAKKRQVVATFDGAALKGNIATATRPHRVSVSLDGRQLVRAPLVRGPVRHQIQLKNRTVVATPQMRYPEASSSITIAAPTKTASIPSSVVANLLQKNVQLPKSGQKIAISGAAGQALAANVQAIAFSTAQLKARQARLVAQPRPAPVAEIVDASAAGPSTSTAEQTLDVPETSEGNTNGAVRRRATDNLPMEVT